MADLDFTVGIVVDRDFGSRLDELAQGMPVCLVDSVGNRGAAEQLWQEALNCKQLKEITTFKVDLSGTPNEWCRDILPTIDLHHGTQSQDPPYSSVVVIGTNLSDELRLVFESYGFIEFSEEGQGFRASAQNLLSKKK